MIFGTRASNIGDFDIPNSHCGYCQNGDIQRVSVFGSYLHIFWIPVFPLGRKAVAECTNCQRTIEQKEFYPELKKQYQENKKKAKRPFWHWLGLAVVGLAIALLSLLIATSESDPRSSLLSADESSMEYNPTMESDSISYKIKQVFDTFAADEIDPSQFKYLTKITGDKALVLVQIPKLRKVEKEGREQAMEMVEMITSNEPSLQGKDVYIGIKGVVTMMLIKTPAYEKNSKIALTSELYEFYGPKAISE